MSNVIINADLSQAELRVMALLSQDPWMLAALQPGQGDFFDNHMMPVCFPWIDEQYGSVEKFKAEEPVKHKEDRTKVKAVQYGLAFDRGAKAIGESLKLSERAAQSIIDNYLATASGFAQWRVDVREAAINPAKRDLLINPFGRRFQSEIITTSNQRSIQREALAFLPQSTSSDICLSTAIRIGPQLADKGYHIFNLVHDAIMIEGEEEGADLIGQYVAQELKATGDAVFGTQLPFASDYSIGKSWADLD